MMDAEVSPRRRQLAPYGRACTNCARAKAKCSRLDKDCQTSTATRKRRTPNRSSANESARLERKLDDLYSLLGTVIPSANPNESPNDGALSYGANNLSQESGLSSQQPHHVHGQEPSSLDSNAQSLHFQPQVPTPAASNGTVSTPAPISEEASCAQEPSESEADDLLSIFRDDMLPSMPFMIIPPFMNAGALRLERPFTWLCIMTITTKSSVQHTVLDQAVRSHLGRLMLIDGEKSLDLLLGLLICIAWAQYQLHTKPITSSLVQLAIGQLAELGLNDAVRKDMPHHFLSYSAQGCPEKLGQRQERTLEERRAAVGCFVVTSVVSNYFVKVDPLPWSGYLEECVDVLQSSPECPNDCLLAHVARLQWIDIKVSQLPGLPRVCEPSKPTEAPWQFYIRAFEAELRECKRSIPTSLVDDQLLCLHLHNTEAKIHEMAFSSLPKDPKTVDIARVESLCAILEATRGWYDVFFTIPIARTVWFPASITTQLAQGMGMLYRLAIFDCSGWDRDLVKQTCDLTNIMTTIIDRMSRVKEAVGPDYDDGSWQIKLYEHTVKKLTFMKTWWQTKESQQQAPAPQPVMTAPEATATFPTDFLSDAWFNDMLMTDNFLLEPSGFGDN